MVEKDCPTLSTQLRTTRSPQADRHGVGHRVPSAVERRVDAEDTPAVRVADDLERAEGVLIRQGARDVGAVQCSAVAVVATASACSSVMPALASCGRVNVT